MSSSSSIRIIIPIIIVIFNEFVSGSQPHHLHQELNFPSVQDPVSAEDVKRLEMRALVPGYRQVLGLAPIKPIFISLKQI
jgi:hypothetical protein